MSAPFGQSGSITEVEFTHGHFFCGLGGGARGFNRGMARIGNLRARWRCLGGIDNDPAGVADFGRLAGVPATLLDLFTLDQYIAFHGHEPPAGWREVTTADIAQAFGGERPNAVFFSSPCKGFSGLLSEKTSRTLKYQALNELTLRGVWLALETWKDDPPELIIFENVPRIATRGRGLIDRIVALLRAYGFAVAETTHDCGELGGLGQSRKRYLLVARHMEKVPPFLYQPEKKSLKGVGEIIGRFPLPGPEPLLPMHRMPRLHWKTWVRLAFVKAGSDWRSLNGLRVEDGMLADYGIMPDAHWHNGAYGVQPWEDPAGTVTSNGRPAGGTFSVADPRVEGGDRRSPYGVRAWDQPTGVVGGESLPSNGGYSVADPRAPQDSDRPSYGVGGWADPAGTVTSQRSPGQGRFSVADPRIDGHEKSVQMGVGHWDQAAAVVKGDVSVGTGRYAVADPRLGRTVFNHCYRIVGWDRTSPAIAGTGGAGGGLAVADPRCDGYSPDAHRNKLKVVDWGRAAGTVTAGKHVQSGGLSVADPRPSQRDDYKQTKYRVTGFDESSGAVIGASTTGNGAFAVADPRAEAFKQGRESYVTGGHYGVVPWELPSGAVTGHPKNNNGPFSVADPRPGDSQPADAPSSLPGPNEQLVCLIRSLDGTWHRPFTTLELAALQSLVEPEEYLELEGQSDSAWRERIGNAVPPYAAEAIASVMAQTLLMARLGITFSLSAQPIWVRNVALALAVDQPGWSWS